MKKVARIVLYVVILCAMSNPAFAEMQTGPNSPSVWPADFWIATAANLIGTGLFLSRMYAPAVAGIFGITTQVIGVPALTLAIYDTVTGNVDPTTVGMFIYSLWAAGAFLVDHVFQIEYRDPVRSEILVPYVVLYYVGIGAASATQLSNGILPWAVAGVTCIAAATSSLVARVKGADT